MESMFEYGSRVGVWRILDVLARHDVPSTFYACAVAFEQAPEVAKAAVAAGHEICSHGYRWEEGDPAIPRGGTATHPALRGIAGTHHRPAPAQLVLPLRPERADPQTSRRRRRLSLQLRC